jgi:hypothetical protein
VSGGFSPRRATPRVSSERRRWLVPRRRVPQCCMLLHAICGGTIRIEDERIRRRSQRFAHNCCRDPCTRRERNLCDLSSAAMTSNSRHCFAGLPCGIFSCRRWICCQAFPAHGPLHHRNARTTARARVILSPMNTLDSADLQAVCVSHGARPSRGEGPDARVRPIRNGREHFAELRCLASTVSRNRHSKGLAHSARFGSQPACPLSLRPHLE